MTEYIRFNMNDDSVENIRVSKEEIEKTPKLCLNMIVKNESKVIRRLLESALPIIDSYCICDTGSTDDTKEIIRGDCFWWIPETKNAWRNTLGQILQCCK